MKGIKNILCIAALAVMVLLTAACSGSEEVHPVLEQKPGTIVNDIYLSQASDFTVKAEERFWRTGAEGGEQELHLTKGTNVWVAFSKTEGLSSDMLEDFEESFAARYVEGVRVSFPDTKMTDCKVISESLARLDMTMTYASGLYPMYQIVYLATDGEDGYIITATLPEDQAESERTTIYSMVESIKFINTQEITE